MPYDADGKKIENPTAYQRKMYKKGKKKKKPETVPLGSGLVEGAKVKLLSRREQIEKALKDAGA